MNKSILILCIIFLVYMSCNPQNNNYKLDIPFIMDTTMCRAYLDVHQFSNHNEYSQTIVSVSQLEGRIYDVIYPILQSKIIDTPDYFAINLINDSIWIVRGIQNNEHSDIYFGNEIYIEVCKQNGKIIKSIIGE